MLHLEKAVVEVSQGLGSTCRTWREVRDGEKLLATLNPGPRRASASETASSLFGRLSKRIIVWTKFYRIERVVGDCDYALLREDPESLWLKTSIFGPDAALGKTTWSEKLPRDASFLATCRTAIQLRSGGHGRTEGEGPGEDGDWDIEGEGEGEGGSDTEDEEQSQRGAITQPEHVRDVVDGVLGGVGGHLTCPTGLVVTQWRFQRHMLGFPSHSGKQKACEATTTLGKDKSAHILRSVVAAVSQPRLVFVLRACDFKGKAGGEALDALEGAHRLHVLLGKNVIFRIHTASRSEWLTIYDPCSGEPYPLEVPLAGSTLDMALNCRAVRTLTFGPQSEVRIKPEVLSLYREDGTVKARRRSVLVVTRISGDPIIIRVGTHHVCVCLCVLRCARVSLCMYVCVVRV